MKSITRLSLALIMFSLFPISYLVTSVSANPDTVCIPESAKDQARRHGYKCMTPETIERDAVELNSRCKQLIIEGHGKFRALNPNNHAARGY
jgi:uncharacterized protein YfaQ (DUF2300 family)